MKEFFNALKWGIIFQLICWVSFLLFDENGILDEMIAMILGIISLVGVLIFYFKKTDKYLKKNKFNPWIFNITLFIFWVITSIGMAYFFLYLVDMKYLHVCVGEGWSCFLNGIEYLVHGIYMIILAFVIIIIKFIMWIYKFIKKKLNKKQD